jgi:hypothetical protein
MAPVVAQKFAMILVGTVAALRYFFMAQASGWTHIIFR